MKDRSPPSRERRSPPIARAATLPLSRCRRIHFTAVLGLTPKISAASRRDRPNVNPGYKLVDNKVYPQIVDDFRKSFRVLKSLQLKPRRRGTQIRVSESQLRAKAAA
jgi:hypothetical protein